MMLERRKNYPRVKVLGGLYTVRRQPKDESLIREVIKAVNDAPVLLARISDEVTRVESRQEKSGVKERLPRPLGYGATLQSVMPN